MSARQVNQEEENAVQQDPAEKSGGVGKLVLQGLGIFVIVLAANLTSGLIMPGPGADDASGEEVAEEELATEAHLPPPIYLPLGEPLIVNFSDGGRLRFVQLGVEVMAREQEVIASVENNLPVLRNNLLMLFGNLQMESIVTQEGKEAMRARALDEIRSVLMRITGLEGIEDLYFTSFVIQ